MRRVGLFGTLVAVAPRNTGGRRLIGGMQLTSIYGTARGDFSKVIRH